MSRPRQAVILRDPHKPGATVLMRRQEEPSTYAVTLECEGHDPASWVYTIAVPCVKFDDPREETRGFEIKHNVSHLVLHTADSKSYYFDTGIYERPIGNKQTETLPGVLLQVRFKRIVTVPEVKPGFAYWIAYRQPASGWALDLVENFTVCMNNWMHLKLDVWRRYIGDGQE